MDAASVQSLLNKIKGRKAVVIGDLVLDRYVVGSASRISDEAPVPIVRVEKTDERPGGAGNTAANLVGIGVNVQVIGLVGADLEAKRLKDILGRRGINTQGIVSDRGRPTTLKTRVVARSQQVVRIDWEEHAVVTGRVEDDLLDLFRASLKDADFVIVSDYGKGACSERLFQLIKELKGEGKLSLKDRPVVIDPNPANYSLYGGFSIAKPNRKEAEDALGRVIGTDVEAKQAANDLREKWSTDVVLLSLGARGMVIASEDRTVTMPTRAREVFDVSGAGDTTTAVFTSAISAGASLEESAQLANIAAGVVVGEVGTVAITSEKILLAAEESQ